MSLEVHLLDYGAGNVRSVVNALQALGCTVHDVKRPQDILEAKKLVFPGVGAFGSCMDRLVQLGYVEPLREYLRQGRPYFGICLGLQTLFEGSEESPGTPGLGVIPGRVSRFPASPGLSVPHMGWNQLTLCKGSAVVPPEAAAGQRFYFVHSYVATPSPANAEWVLSLTDYGVPFVSSLQKGSVVATQFHPEKSGELGLAILRRFLLAEGPQGDQGPGWSPTTQYPRTQLAKRIIACLDVRSNDAGDLVVTKGDQYDVRERTAGREVRNLGKPVALAQQYYQDGADEITFLNITSFRSSPLKDQPMLEVLRQASAVVFVPLTIGGGIAATTDPNGTPHDALEVASEYFRSGADKVSIGSDAVLQAEEYIRSGRTKTGQSSIEQISRVYGRQAVVISVDPKRVYVGSPEAVRHHTIPTATPGPNGERFVWYQCTVKGGREARDLGAYELVQACEQLGAGEILLNCIDKDGTKSGFDLELIAMVKGAVTIPVIASSGAGCAAHFAEVLQLAQGSP
eukprot:RCo016332